MLIGNIIAALEQYAPPALQEDYDNTGLIIGRPTDECTGVLLTVDVSPTIVREAAERGLNLIVAHHPLIFKGLKRLNGSTTMERSVIEAIHSGIAIYACHTSMDNADGGVSHRMTEMLGLQSVKVLDRQPMRQLKLTVFVPKNHVDEVRLALFDAGAGHIGNYDSCSYATAGEGTFRALDAATPFVGAIGEYHTEPEYRLEVIVPSWRMKAVEQALLQVHPYEEPAYEFIQLQNPSNHWGCGCVGNLPEPMPAAEFVEKVKASFGSPVARCTAYEPDGMIRRVALCGGSGSFLVGKALSSGAQAFITSDTKYHDFVDYAGEILIVDIGHHESENCTKDIFYKVIREKFPNFAVEYSQQDTNPIKYL